MKLLRNFALLATVIVTFTVIACNNEDEEPQKADLDFLFDFTVDGQDFVLNQVYTINGTAVSFEIASFYVGGIKLEPESGPVVDLSNNYLLVSPQQQSYEVTEDLEPGHYHVVEFFVGVAPEENNQSDTDFSTRSGDDPLGEQFPAMHWNWNSGYKFLRMDGLADTDGDGTPETPIAYHIGTDNLLKNLEFDHTDLVAGSNTISFTFDLVSFFKEVDLSTDLDTHTGNNLPLAQKLVENLESAVLMK